ncbi:dihydroorotate oxidase B, electron transfer subunit [Candidatus Thermokryptus mobilis]|uniref:Dihydroorotate dehydrogenase B (NAD(+)), electron transfer subunit n=1 Tax=Candidatus Thermokryptus mobilis TaxID=1643428 RepID=A0A0S4N7H1_9BACT|nr:dihydroorotate dehydrogenase electron transfer subunit [Candidatus Thermokryptus mobilis]CUU05789.1 dihydroorotate oxidase B, electron transfer subunit [Candidatus Thermokryptus mobilis]
MIIKLVSTVKLKEHLTDGIFRLTLYAPEIASISKPGQFVNVKVSDYFDPLLRRPFSICDADGEYIKLIFNIAGKGTKILAELEQGDEVDLFGPLGRGFEVDDDFDVALIVAGGLGVAPFPFLVKILKEKGKRIVSYVGARTKEQVISDGLENVNVATDDGSAGFKGTVVELVKLNILNLDSSKIKIFGCGPTPMLKSLVKLCDEYNLKCEVSVETAMACGTGLCQGCVVTTRDFSYKLACKDGPVFNVREILI